MHTLHKNEKNLTKLEKFSEEKFKELIINNISYYNVIVEKKNLSELALGIQYDISIQERDFKYLNIYLILNYSWFVVTSKSQIYSNHFKSSCEVLYHCKIIDNDKELNIQGLRDTEILIYKKQAIFESVLKNILTGKFYEVELKHIIILVSVVIFFILMSVCKKDYTELDNLTNLSFFEEKVCVNKRSIMSTIAIMFIFVIISTLIGKRLKKQKTR